MNTRLADPLIGVVLDRRYEISALLAHGGMSTVYSGKDLRLDRAVAIKVMSPALGDDPAFAQHFTQEARAAARLSHPGVVSVFDQGEDAGRVFLVMELVHGQTLRHLLREKGPLSPELALSILEQMLAALAAAHRAGLVHRDVKPENVLLAQDGLLKVADFGLAKALAVASRSASLVMGTAAYVAPEQITRGTSDARTDLYGAGIVLYEMLTGAPPYQGDTPISVAYRHAHEDVPAPSAVVPDIPPPLDDLVLRATRRDPVERPADANAMLASLQDVRTELGLKRVRIPASAESSDTTNAEPRHTRILGQEDAKPWVSPTAPTSVTSLRRPDNTPSEAGNNGSGRNILPLSMPSPDTDPSIVRRYTEQRRRGLRQVWLWLAVVLLLGGLAAFAGWWLGAGRYASVPKVRGITQAAAIDKIRSADLKVRSAVQQSFDDNVPAGQVAGTRPKAGVRMHRGEALTLVISRGPQPETIPDVRGKSREDATKTLSALHLRVQVSQDFSDTIPDGEVISTDPTPGATVLSGSKISMTVSRGPAPVDVPNVVGRSTSDATALLQNAGLKVSTDSQSDDDVPAGTVISQDPAEGTVDHGSTVHLVVSSGSALVRVPSVTGERTSDARKKLTEAGFKVDVNKILGIHTGRVFTQSPSAGSKQKPGTTIHIGVL